MWFEVKLIIRSDILLHSSLKCKSRKKILKQIKENSINNVWPNMVQYLPIRILASVEHLKKYAKFWRRYGNMLSCSLFTL